MQENKTTTDTVVIGAGQAGVAMSAHLGKLGVPHLVLERSRIAEQWRTGRWDSLVANGPAWHDRFPEMEFDDLDPGAFASKDRVAAYFEAYAKKINAPIRTGVDVTSVTRNSVAFRASTTAASTVECDTFTITGVRLRRTAIKARRMRSSTS